MKKFLLFISFCLLCLTQIGAEIKTYEEDFSSNNFGFETASQGKAGSLEATSSVTGLKFIFNWTNRCYKNNNKYLMIGYQGSSIQLPTFEGIVKSIAITSTTGVSTKCTLKITDDAGNEVVAAKTLDQKGIPFTFAIPENYQGSGKIYKIVTGNTGTGSVSAQIAKIAITVDEGEPTQVATPTTTASKKMLYGADFTISTSTEGATLYYTLDNTENWKQAESNPATLNAPTEGESFTIKAKATKEGLDDSDILTVENIALYSNGVANIKDFLAAADTEEAKTFKNSVTAIYQNGSNLWVKDDSGYIVVYGSTGRTYAEGDVIPAGFSGKYTLYKGLPELGTPTDFAASTENTGAVAPEEVTVELLAACDLNTYVSIKNAKYDGTNFSDDDTNSIALGKDYSGVKFESGKTYDITGFYSIDNNGNNITIISAIEKQLVADLEITPAFGDIIIGETITISCATEGATIAVGEISGGAETIDLSGKTFPYTYTIKEEDLDKTLKIEAYASLAGYVDSPVLTGNYTVIAPTPAEAVFTNEAGEVVTGGDVKQGSYIKFSWESGCSAEVDINGTVTPYDAESTFEIWSVDAKKYAAGDVVTISVTVTNKYNKTSTATATFTVENPYKVVDVITVDDTGAIGTSYTTFSGVIKNGAEYAGRLSKYSNKDLNLNQIQLNYKDYNANTTSGAYGSAIFMTKSVGKVSKIILDIAYIYSNSNTNAKCYVYGNHTPYNAYIADGTTTTTPAQEDAYTYQTTNLGTLIGEFSEAKIETIENPGVTVDNSNGYQYILILVDGTTRFNSITFEWEDAFEYGKEIKYEMQSETTKLTEGKFVTLVDTKNSKAVSRNNAAEGTIAGAAASIAEADENSKTSLTLGKGQFSIDEFELVPVIGGGFKLYGGGSITRRYIGYNETGLTTTADETKAAVVTLESDGTGVVVKFADDDIIVSDGTNFGKGTPTGTESPASLTEGETLVPAYVFVSPGEDSTGVEDIEMVETEAPAQYYNLNGVEVKAGNLVPGIYIVRQGNKVSKQFIR